MITGVCCYFKIKLDRHSHQFDIAQCVYLYWADFFSCSFLTVACFTIHVLKSMNWLKKDMSIYIFKLLVLCAGYLVSTSAKKSISSERGHICHFDTFIL